MLKNWISYFVHWILFTCLTSSSLLFVFLFFFCYSLLFLFFFLFRFAFVCHPPSFSTMFEWYWRKQLRWVILFKSIEIFGVCVCFAAVHNNLPKSLKCVHEYLLSNNAYLLYWLFLFVQLLRFVSFIGYISFDVSLLNCKLLYLIMKSRTNTNPQRNECNRAQMCQIIGCMTCENILIFYHSAFIIR